MNNQPLVSIIIPVYNGDPYLREAIDSALAQTYPNIEVIVVNDGSPDGGKTERIAQSYGDRIRYFYKENGGVASALNFGIANMQGEWFSWLSHDDLYLPEKIQMQMDAAARLGGGEPCVVRCSTASMDENGRPVFRPQRCVDGRFSAIQMYEMHALKEIGLYGCTLLIHKTVLNVCGPFDEELKTTQDEDYWARILFAGTPFLSVPEVLVKIRIHAGQTTNRLSDRLAAEEGMLIEKEIRYYRADKTAGRPFLFLLACKQAKEQRKQQKDRLLGVLKQDAPLSIKQRALVHLYTVTGFAYAWIKKAYRAIIIKKHRGPQFD